MSVILKDAQPPLVEVAKLKGKASQVYSLLWESASKDVRYDKRLHLQWKDRRDAGGTTHWSIKGIASELKLHRTTVTRAVCCLLDSGLIQVDGFFPTGSGSDQTVFRVTHPDQLEAVRYAISMISSSPSQRWQNHYKQKYEPGFYIEPGDVWDRAGMNDAPYLTNPNYNGLYEDDGVAFEVKVKQRLDKWQQIRSK